MTLKNPALLMLLSSPVLMFPTGASAEMKPGAWRGQSVSEFSAGEDSKFSWRIVNDGVMGGLSQGKLDTSSEGIVTFSGDLSLENNGGFSSFRSEKVSLNLSNDLGLLLKVRGDGRTYQARFGTDARYRGMEVSFAGEFATKKGQWTQVKVPFADFKASFRGLSLPKQKLDPSMIQRVGILLADKQSGPFKLEIDWIRTYGKGQGNYVEREQPAAAEGKTADAKPARLIATVVADGRFTTLKKALDTAGLTTFFQWDNPLTVFAPTDEAFAKLPAGILENLLKPENKQQLVSLLSYHVSPGSHNLADSLKAKEVKTVHGKPLEFSFSSGRVRISGAALIDSDIQCQDGVIQVIDTVLIPETDS